MVTRQKFIKSSAGWALNVAAVQPEVVTALHKVLCETRSRSDTGASK